MISPCSPKSLMTRAILLVDHGSRREDANRVIEAVAAALRARRPDWVVETAHLEVAPPDVSAGIDACVAAGAREIVLHPYFLAPGMHAARDIAALVERARARHPEVTIRITEPLGFHSRIVDVVLERVDDA